MGAVTVKCSLALLALLVAHASAVIPSPPRIIKQPPPGEQLFQVITQPSEQDKPFVIECEAEGEPPPQYRWIKNGKPFQWQVYDDRMSQQDGRGTLVVTSPRHEDIGQYQCFAYNELGEATSNTVFMRKAELNSFKEESPKRETVNEGQPFHLTCQPPDGWPKPNVHWLIQNTDGVIKSINNSRMTLDPEGTLWFSNVTKIDASDDFSYACSATSLFRSEYKIGNRVNLEVISAGSSAGLNKHEPVRQYTSRKNEVAMRGKKVELFCIFGGTPLPQTVWSKNGKSVEVSDRVTQGHYGKSLIIKHVTIEDAGAYTCEVSNGVGEAQTYSITLHVEAAPYFKKEPQFQSKAEDETVVFECEASGQPLPEIKWIHNGKPIAEAPFNPRRKVTPNSIIIEKLEKKDTGNYGCNATNSHGYVYKDVYVNVLRLPPEITDPPKNESTVDGRTVTLTCRAFGAPNPEVKWIRNGIELTGGRYVIQESGDLVIRDASFADSGTYTCYASSRLGAVQAAGSLQVKEHTRITTLPEDYEVPAGSTATFRCNAVTDPSLALSIEWLNNGQPIDFESEPRFVRTKDYSLTITKTTELDSGLYTCLASTNLDSASANASLIVQDAPNAPELTEVVCKEKQAVVSWFPMGDNRAPILHYTIQYNTSFTPDSWETAFEEVPATETTFKIPTSPWANYTFRVIAWNKIGKSPPSGHSFVCTTLPDVPYKNPDNVKGEGTRKDNLVISWTAMPEIDHNAPGFKYRVMWKRDIPGEQWDNDDINDWRRTSLELHNLPTFQRYRIQVKALNEKGEANVAPTEIIGFSGEDYPTSAPQNFTVEEVVSAKEALLSWSPVPVESVRGHFRGYKIQTWTDKEGMDGIREHIVKGQKTREVIPIFVPHTKNFARVLVFNDHYNGPASDTVSFDTPEGTPGPVRALEGVPIGSSAIFLEWKEPAEHNGVLTGYKIYYQVVNGTKLGGKLEREPHINGPKIVSAKLSGLQPNTTYRFSVVATTSAGEGAALFDEKKTFSSQSPPDRPTFYVRKLASGDGHAAVLVKWAMPKTGHPGSHFFVKYKLRGESQFTETRPEFNELETEVKPLKPGEIYIFKLVAVDGEFLTESLPEEVETSNDGPIIQPRENVAAAGWFIGMMLAIAFLLLVLIIVCIIKRNRGGKYVVHEREAAHGRLDYPEEPGFHEYSQPLENPSHGRSSMGSDPKHDPYNDGDNDSLAEYGDGDTGQFTEDGSFIGQYGPNGANGPNGGNGKKRPVGDAPSPSAIATYV